MLRAAGAEADHVPELIAKAKKWHDAASESEKSALLVNINAGLPGAYERYDIPASAVSSIATRALAARNCARISRGSCAK